MPAAPKNISTIPPNPKTSIPIRRFLFKPAAFCRGKDIQYCIVYNSDIKHNELPVCFLRIGILGEFSCKPMLDKSSRR
jgi:hypothetical protein